MGADWIPGHPMAHGSGFRWGMEQLPEDFGFHFAATPDVAPESEPPDHPSGFRFAGGDAAPTHADHPSGFSWRDRAAPPPFAAVAPARFRWADGHATPRRPRAFHWKNAG